MIVTLTCGGYIGAQLTMALQARGNHVMAISAADPIFEDFLRATRPDVIVHAGPWGTVPEPGYDDTAGVAEAALAYGQRVILLSTAAVYGEASHPSAAETAWPQPVSRYGELAWQAEETLARYNRVHHCRHVILRLGNVYGPGHPVDSVIPEMAERASLGEHPAIFGDGRQTRDFVFITDAVQAVIAAMCHPGAGTWNIGTGTGTSISQLAALIAGVTQIRIPPVCYGPSPGDIRHSVLSAARARRELGWRARVSLPDGLRQVCGA